MIVKIFYAFAISLFSLNLAYGESLLQVPAVIHLSSNISEGKYSLSEIAEISRRNNIKVVVVTDYYLNCLKYGIWPLRNIIKKTVEFNSVSKFGIERYLNAIKETNKINPQLIIIPAVEAAPFYYWEVDASLNNLKICDWHKHLLAIGMERPQDYRKLPVLGNAQGISLPFSCKDVIRLWPVIIFLLGIIYLRKSSLHKKSYAKMAFYYARISLVLGILFVIVGAIFLCNNFPFCSYKFSPYQGNLGIAPYQNFIDYVGRHGGLTFWAHPEAENVQREGKIKIETRDYTSDLMAADHYTGFAIFYEGYYKIGCIGCLWDEILKQYCRGARKSPIWAIGGLSFDDQGSLDEAIQDLRNMLLIPKFNKNEILKAMRQGSIYVLKGKNSARFILDEFSVRDSSSNDIETMGRTLSLTGRPEIIIKGHFMSDSEAVTLNIKLIKEGKVIKTFETVAPFDVVYRDEISTDNPKTYYRLELEAKDLLVITNPIFIERLAQKQKIP